MEKIELIALARQVAPKHSLDETLVCAVIEQESNWRPWLNRYEPGFEELYGKTILVSATAFKKDISLATEIKNRCNSWGLMQLMGETAREFGFSGDLPSLCDPETGIQWGCIKLAKCMSLANGVQASALLRWNGGGNPLYDKEVLARVPNYIISQGATT